MAKRAPLRSRFSMLAIVVALGGCQASERGTTVIPNVTVSADAPGWQRHDGQLWFAKHPFSGRVYECTAGGDTLFSGTYLEGKAEGLHRHWYTSGQLKEERQYRNGWQEGEQRGWHESGKRAFVYQFAQDVYEGRRNEWYANGQPAQAGTYHNGQENGPQRQWFNDGTLKVNYEARNGRNYGFTGVKNCANVWDSIRVSH
nr:membrane-binding protein [Fibrella sp. ES10-3-2-2]